MAEKRSKRERKVRSNTVSYVIELFKAFCEKIVIELFAALATAHTKAYENNVLKVAWKSD